MKGLHLLVFLILTVLCMQVNGKSMGNKKSPAKKSETILPDEEMAVSTEVEENKEVEDMAVMMESSTCTTTKKPKKNKITAITEAPMNEVGEKPENIHDIEDKEEEDDGDNEDKEVKQKLSSTTKMPKNKPTTTNTILAPEPTKETTITTTTENPKYEPKDENNAAEETDDDDEVMTEKAEEDDDEVEKDPLNMMPPSTNPTTTNIPKQSSTTTSKPDKEQLVDEQTSTTTTMPITIPKPDSMEEDIQTILEACKELRSKRNSPAENNSEYRKRHRRGFKKERKALKKLCREIGRHQAAEEHQKIKEAIARVDSLREDQSPSKTFNFTDAIKRLEDRLSDHLPSRQRHH